MMDILEAQTSQAQSSNESDQIHVKVGMLNKLSILSNDKRGMREYCDQSELSTIRRSMREIAVIDVVSAQTWY